MKKSIIKKAFSQTLKGFKKPVIASVAKQSRSACFQASMTIEAALALPLFLFFMLTVLYTFQIIYLQTESYQLLHQAGNRQAFSAYADREGYGDGIVELSVSYPILPYLWWQDYGGFLQVNQRYYGYAWIGYEVGEGAGAGEKDVEYVYIAETGTVYHVTMNCTHLALSITSVSRGEIPALRNKDGAKYYPCERCADDGSAVLFITETGNRYHGDINCSGLKRTVTKIAKEEAINQGYRGCSRCS
ncbi:MAG: pilus assembly protein [Lachnospiraceae bacterium]|jgi:hypothetical protein|nr:pilus assembly protein [Lachnospiraceae bacterium]